VGWKSPSDSSTGLSVAEGNCVVERRGGEQPEAKDQSINKTMLNSIRPDALATKSGVQRTWRTIQKLEQELRTNQYRPQAVKRVWIPKPGSQEKRPLGVPTVRDRIEQGAVLQVIEPLFEREFAKQSYGFRSGKGCKDALRRVDELLRSGYHWVVDADLKSYFDSIPHEGLMERVGEKIADCRVLSLIRGMLQAGVMDRMKGWQATEQGSPQGAGISPLLSNIYLNGVDWKMARKGFEMVR
jgi:RNA-directed DNA polymerase